MRCAIKAAAVAVICCSSWAFADAGSGQTFQAPVADAFNITIQAPTAGNFDEIASNQDGKLQDSDDADDQDDQGDHQDQDAGKKHEKHEDVLIRTKNAGKDDQPKGYQQEPVGQAGGPRGVQLFLRMQRGMGGGPREWMMQRGQGDGERGRKQPKGLMLGVATDRPDPALTSQLNLPDGIGLVVEQVLPNSAASKAGIKQYDVLEKLDDQLVVNVEQVGVLIRMHKPGDEITLTIIRHGKTREVTATLGESKERPDRRDGNRPPRRNDPGANGSSYGPGPGWGFGNRRPMQQGPNTNRDKLQRPSQDGPKTDDNSTPDTSGAPSAQPAPAPRHHQQKDDNEDSNFTPAPATQPSASVSELLNFLASPIAPQPAVTMPDLLTMLVNSPNE